ncbi:DUF5068 domain-containing protein [Gracilibacillus oryzae]|uniref:DUF5068 domain-containing protein n=1 Tax=Gracilibacillus oryzae TaxID=1672701 RepID=A0A7C8KS03_9BACI|nr:DUF5068 domain-containing protein [Gracilibacillus oryzae]KAB8125937.1 DUF5068 domain-containing protein [Gracilibacillus oryzae]
MKKFLFLFMMACFFGGILAGCGSTNTEAQPKEEKEETSTDELKEETKEEPKEESEDESVETESVEEDNIEETSTAGFSEVINHMEEVSEGTAEILFEGTETFEHEMEGVTTSVDTYALVELTDFHTDFSIPFDDETDGAVLLVQYTVKNDTEKDAYYMPSFYLTYTGATKSFYNYKELLPEEQQLPTLLSASNDYLIEAGKSHTGYFAYPFGKSILPQVLEEGIVSIEVPRPHATKGDVNDNFGSETTFHLGVTEAASKKVTENQSFYQDKLTTANMGEKVMIEEQQDIGTTETISDFDITLEGYQFTDFTPNEVEAPRFENFTNGMVMLTVKFLIDNKSDADIGISSLGSKLTVNDGAQYMLDQGMLLDYGYDDVIAAGESGELLQIYVLDKEQYDKIWKEKSFELELGPMKDTSAKDISKGKTATFKLK